MRIAIDARELQGKPTGVGRYVAELLAEWNRLPDAAAHHFTLCAPDHIRVPHLDRLRVSTVAAPGSGTWWEQRVLPGLVRQTAADVLFAPAYTGPLQCPAPMVLVIHDVSFAAHPEWFGWTEGLRRRTVTRLAARRAARVLTVSEFSKREIVSHLGIAPDHVDVIYHGPPSPALIRPDAAAPDLESDPGTERHRGQNPVRDDSRLPPRPGGQMILYVGSILNRRHVPSLIEGFARLARRHADVRLEIVGDNRTRPFQDIEAMAAASGAGDRIAVRAYVDDGELASLYSRARVFAFFSEYEGFGLTPLEALAAGIPVVVLDTPVAREIYAAAALYVARPEPAAIDTTLERALLDERARQAVLDASGSVLARYSWRECARQVLDALVGAAQGKHRA